jgi:hypothetical protein
MKCRKCGSEHPPKSMWQGENDAVTINCLTRQLAARSAECEKLRALVANIEWWGDDYIDRCPECRGNSKHNPDCELAALLNEKGE